MRSIPDIRLLFVFSKFVHKKCLQFKDVEFSSSATEFFLAIILIKQLKYIYILYIYLYI